MTLLKTLNEWTDDHKLNADDHLQNYSNHRDIEDKISHFSYLTQEHVNPENDRFFPHINDYTGDSSPVLNTDMWRIKLGYKPHPDTVDQIKNVSKEMDEFPAYDEKLTVYSGLSREHLKNQIPNGIVHIPSLLSTSLSPNVAHAFSTGHGRLPEGHMLRIHIPPHKKYGAYIETASEKPEESEYLFHPNILLKIKSRPSQIIKDEEGKRIHIWDASVMEHKDIEKHLAHPEVQSYLKMKELLK